MTIRRLKVCLNGGRTPDQHPAVPVTPFQLATAARAAVDAGAEAVHVHPRDRDGRESLVAADVGAAVRAIRAACPGVPVGVTTGLWITGGEARQRSTEVGWWADLAPGDRPDFASVNVSEEGYAALVSVLRAAGIGAEAGVWSVEDAARAGSVPLVRVLVEVLRTPADQALGVADAILARLDAAGVRTPRLLHGEQEACWPLVTHAGHLGLPTRIGLEDTLVTPDGSPAADNAALVRAALARLPGVTAASGGSRAQRRRMRPVGWDALGRWGDDAVRIEPLTGGVANDVWSVRVGGRLAVGRLGTRSDADLAWETGLIQHLDREGLTVPVPIPTRDGRLFADGLVVMTYLDGGPPETPADWRRVAGTLRELHRLTRGWPQRPGWRSSTDLLQAETGTRIDLGAMPPESVARCRAAWARLTGRTVCVVHGNPAPGNVRMTANQVALIDWDESHVDVPDLDLVLPGNAGGLDDGPYDIAAQASAAWEAAVCWDDEFAVRRLAEVRAV